MLNINIKDLGSNDLPILVEEVRQGLEEGAICPIELKSYLVYISKFTDLIKEELNSAVLHEITGKTPEERIFKIFVFSESSTGVKLDYSKDWECTSLEAEMNDVKRRLKARQDKLKAQYKAFENQSNKFSFVNKETGEVNEPLPVLEPSKTVLKVSMK